MVQTTALIVQIFNSDNDVNINLLLYYEHVNFIIINKKLKKIKL